jgi:prepilin-type processing-associated H-X9-DG protein/prepilin-type N-terminal cleavage/methylation domain-containing protein
MTNKNVSVHRKTGCSGRGEPAAFTLVELLTVVSIMALLMAILLPSYSQARQQARAVVCLSNERQIGMAIHAYAEDYQGRFPIAHYSDAAHRALVAWDTITYASDRDHARPGLIWRYAKGNAVQQCPSYRGPSLTSGDAFTGYNYNTTYLGRGQGEPAYRGMGEAPASVSDVRYATSVALIGDGGYRSGANKFMRAPHDAIGEGTVHAGAQAYRHLDKTNVLYADGHAAATRDRYRKPGARSDNEELLDWPNHAFLSSDDAAYAHR